MARKKNSASGAGDSGRRRKAGGKTSEADPVDAALSLAGTQGWSHVTIEALAHETGLELAELYRRFPSRAAILQAFAQRIDQAMLASPVDATESHRDRLFALVMSRFDALQPFKAGVISILRSLPFDPAPMVCGGVPALFRSAAWALEAAGISSNGFAGGLRVRALGLTYLDVIRVWAKDDSPDMSATMAALDKRLVRLERLANMLNGKGKMPFFRGAGS